MTEFRSPTEREYEAGNCEKPEWRRRLYEEIGEDPVELLDKPAVATDDEDNLAHARARIRGIAYLDVLRAWKAAERRHDRGPREQVMGWLEEREAFLEEHGDRNERYTAEDPEELRKRADEKADHEEESEIAYQCCECGTLVRETGQAYFCPICEHTTRNVEKAEGMPA